ncbi:FeoB-associated Cys-rich membrane protein [Desulfolithobacter sp.]
MQNLAVLIIVAVVALSLVIRLFKRLTGKTKSGCGWSCSNCSASPESCEFKLSNPEDTNGEKQ